MSRTRALSSAAVVALAFGGALPAADAQQPAPPPKPDDILGNIVVVAEGQGRPLPKVAVYPSLASDEEDVTLRSVVRRDLDLCGEFEVLPDSQAPEGLYLDDAAIDAKAWAGKGVEALVRVRAKKAGADKVELKAQAYLVKRGPDAIFEKRFHVPLSKVREESHRVADLVIGALTGQNGGFASRMTFVSGSGKTSRVFVIDSDGNGARPVSPEKHLAIAPAFGKDDQLFWAASIDNDEYKVFSTGGGPFQLPIKGSVYGLAFSRDRSQVAVAIGIGPAIKLFAGPDFARIKPAATSTTTLHPVFTPSGKLAYAGEGRYGQRIFVDGKPITPEGLFASSPTFCNHPDGVRVIFAAGAGKNQDLVATGENGGGLVRLTQNQGNNSSPACSPDGRLVAFFSTRNSNEGPGLYIMRVDGARPKRISTLLGDALRWDPLPKGSAVEVK